MQTARKQCTVVYATAARAYQWSVDLPAAASIADALAAARASSVPEEAAAIPWEHCAVGIFGELRRREELWADGDRIELYRPLQCDPRQRRRERVQRQRSAGSRR
jgi:uncharacterized protein